MKLTKNKDKYLLELNKFERDCLFVIAGSSSGRGKVSLFLSDIYDKLVHDLRSNEGEDVYSYYNHLIDKSRLQAKVELYDNLEQESFDFAKKQNCSFFYPKSAYRNKNTKNIEHFEPRSLKDAYIEGDYLIGFDKTIKKFSLNKVKHLTWE